MRSDPFFSRDISFNRIVFLILLMVGSIRGVGQNASTANDIGFAGYLIENKAYRDAIFVLREMVALPFLKPEQKDSVQYMIAWSYFSQRKVDSSLLYFPHVSKNSAFYHKSTFYSSFGHVYQGNREQARQVLNEISSLSDSTLIQLRLYYLAGISLMDRDFEEYRMYRGNINQPYYPLAAEVSNLAGYSDDLQKIKKRSPLVAGLLSAFIPGSGKFYAGYKMQGLAAFVQVLTFGAAAAENYFKESAGPQSARFIALGSLFSIFYIGNIWGSVLSVKIKRNEQYREIDQAILVDLRVPLVRLFP